LNPTSSLPLPLCPSLPPSYKKIFPTFPQRKTNPKLLQISELSQDLETQVLKASSMSKTIITQTQFSKLEFRKLSRQRLPRACKMLN
jgi:hypothetical protein